MRMRTARRNAILFVIGLIAGLMIGCQHLGAWMGELQVSKDGEVRGTMESAGEGGDFHRNTGLNLSAGENGLAALIIAGSLVVVLPFVYPVQRALRLRKERVVEDKLRREGRVHD